jgi:hypothetical protein
MRWTYPPKAGRPPVDAKLVVLIEQSHYLITVKLEKAQ